MRVDDWYPARLRLAKTDNNPEADLFTFLIYFRFES